MPSFFPKVIKARELIAAAMLEYMRKGGYKTASGLIRKRYEHHRDMFGMTLEDVARGELGNSFGVLSNSSIAPLWLLYHIFSDERVLADVRREVSALVVQESDGGGGGGTLNSVALGDVRKACPVLMSTFQETMRLHNVNPGPRVLLEDVDKLRKTDMADYALEAYQGAQPGSAGRMRHSRNPFIFLFACP